MKDGKRVRKFYACPKEEEEKEQDDMSKIKDIFKEMIREVVKEVVKEELKNETVFYSEVNQAYLDDSSDRYKRVIAAGLVAAGCVSIL